MTNRQQSAFFLAIIFLFASGIGLVIYREYDQYYQQKTATELEAAETPSVAVEKLSASSTPQQISDWKIYKNDQYGFEVNYPASFVPQANVDSETVLSLYRSYGEGNAPEYVAFHKVPDQGSFQRNVDYAKLNLANNFKNYQGLNWTGFYQTDEGPKQGGGDLMYIIAPGQFYVAEQFNGQGNLTHELFLQILLTFKFTK